MGNGEFTFDRNAENGKELKKACDEKGLNMYSVEKPSVIRKSVVSTNVTTKSRAVNDTEISKLQKKHKNVDSNGDQGLGKFGFGKVNDENLSNNSSILRRVERASKKRCLDEIHSKSKSPPKKSKKQKIEKKVNSDEQIKIRA